jgi:hypothetical protein
MRSRQPQFRRHWIDLSFPGFLIPRLSQMHKLARLSRLAICAESRRIFVADAPMTWGTVGPFASAANSGSGLGISPRHCSHHSRDPEPQRSSTHLSHRHANGKSKATRRLATTQTGMIFTLASTPRLGVYRLSRFERLNESGTLNCSDRAAYC